MTSYKAIRVPKSGKIEDFENYAFSFGGSSIEE